MSNPTVIRQCRGPRVVVRHDGLPGKQGVDGEPGEVSSATSSSVSDEVVLFNGTTGKQIKRSNVLIGSLATATDLSGKVDKVTGYGLSQNDFTNARRAKLDGLSTATYRGTYDDEAALVAALPTPNDGDYAYVVSPIPGGEQVLWHWDKVNNLWTATAPGSTPSTGAEIKTVLFAEPDTHNLTDSRLNLLNHAVQDSTFDSVIQTLTGGAAPTTNVITDATTARTPTPADAGKFIILTAGSTCTITIQDDATALWTLFPPITFYVSNAVPTVVADPGVTVSDPSGILSTLVTGSCFTLKKIGADAWVVIVGM